MQFQIQVINPKNGETMFTTAFEPDPAKVRANLASFATAFPTQKIMVQSSGRGEKAMTPAEFVKKYPEETN